MAVSHHLAGLNRGAPAAGTTGMWAIHPVKGWFGFTHIYMNAVMVNKAQHFLYLFSFPIHSFLTTRNWKSFGRVEWLCMQDIVSKQNFSKTLI